MKKEQENKRLSVVAVVVTYNRLELLKECISGLKNQNRPIDEILVINNGCTDETALWLNQQKNLTVIVQENLGGAGGFYRGLKEAYERDADWIWVMDDDAIADSNALSVLISNIENQVNILAACGVVMNHKGIDVLHRQRVMKNPFMLKWVPLSVNEYTTNTTIDIDMFSFVGAMISRRAIIDVGLPKKDFFLHFDDTEYSLRIRSKGRIILVPASIILHKEAVKSEYTEESRELALKKFVHRYYSLRNGAWLYRTYTDSYLQFICTFTSNYSKIIASILLKQKYKMFKLKIVYNAMRNGLYANFDNNIVKELIKKI